MSGSSIFGDPHFRPSLIDPAQLEPRGISRRTSLFAGLAAPVVAGRLRPVHLGAQYVSQGRSLSDLTNMLGVCTITSTTSGPYGNRPEILRALQELGATWIRSKIFTGNKRQVAWLNELAASGIKTNALVHGPGGKDSPEASVALVASSRRGAVERIEGPNEWNLKGGADWVAELVDHQTRLWNAVKSNPDTQGITVVGPALGMRKGFDELGDRTAIMDWGNIHLYTGGFVPGYRSDTVIAGERIVCGSKQITLTETGWHNAAEWTGPHYYTPEDVAGVYAPRLLLEYFIRDVPRLSIYQLVNNPAARDARESNFGLLRADFSRKPAFVALANLHTILTRTYRTTGRSGAPVSLAFRDGPSDLRSALVDRGDGRSLLFLWRSETAIYDPKRRIRLTPATATATIDWGATYNVQRFAPTDSADALETQLTSVSSVSLGGDMQILEVSPG